MATLLERAERIRDEVQEAANTAQRVGQLLVDFITEVKGADSRYLSGIRPDTAHAPIRFAQGLTAKEVRTEGTEQVQEQLVVGDFLSGQSGARINKDGAAEVETLTVRSRLEVAEMQINRLTAVEGDWLLTESGTVEQVEQRGTQWVLTMRRRFEGDITAFAVHDVIKGIVSTAAVRAFRPNTPLPTPETALYAVAWLRVESVDINDNSITCSLYDNADVPGGANMQPCEGMNLARWGNTSIAERRSCLYLSSREGRIMHLQGVTAPKITAEHQRASFGTLPDFLKAELGEIVDGKDDYLFARGLVVQDIIRLDAKANPIPEIVDRGNWKQGAKYYGGTRNPETKRFEISDVWLDGARWRCSTTKSEGTTETPAPNSIHWTLIQAKPKNGRDGDAGLSVGVNLLDGTNFNTGIPIYASPRNPKWPYVTGVVTVLPGGKNGANVICAIGQLNIIRASIPGEKLTVGKTYVVSFWYRTDGYLHLWYNYPDNGHLARTNSERLPHSSPAEYNDGALHNSVEWKRYTKAFTWHGTSPYCGIYVDLNDADSGKWIEICGLKVEEGDTPTTWCLSENDKIGAAGIAGRDGESYHVNLIDNSSFAKGLEGWGGGYGMATFDDSMQSPVPGTRVVKITGQAVGRLPYHEANQNVRERLLPNTTYTYSVWVKTTEGMSNARIIVYPAPHIEQKIDYEHGGEWTRHAITFTTRQNFAEGQYVYLRLGTQTNPNAAVWFAAPKLEVGDTPTEWTTSENDRKGDNGRGVSRMRAFYMLTTERNAPQPDTSEWTETAPQPTKERPWLWSYERSEYTDGDYEQTVVRLIGHYGKDGTNGTSIRAQYSADAQTWHDDFAAGDVWMRTGNGTTWGGALRVVGESGADGKSPVYDFAASTKLTTASSTTAPTIRGTWQDAPPTLKEGEVLWYRLTAANGKITYGRLSGEKGKTSYTHIAYANSEDGAKDFTLEEDLGRGGEIEFSYFGIYADFDERASQDNHDYVWTRLRGVDGKDGLTPNANLLDDTDFKNLGRKESAWSVGTFGEEPLGGRANADLFPPSVSGCYPALCSINPGTKQGEYAHLWQNIGRLIPGRTYTFSVYVRGASDAWLIVYPNPNEHFRPNTVKPDEWTRVSLTFTAPKTKGTEDTLIFLRAWHREEQPHKGFAKNVVWCAPKLEEGGIPTPWTPSRNDLRGKDGAPGARGAVVRQFGDYAKLPDGTAFESGHTGEQYVDVVQVRQGAQVQFYQCKQPHTKSADKAPAADSEWWELGMYQGFIATDLLLAERSLIKNLQVENVVGRDANGNTTFDLDASTGTAYFGGTATFAGFIRRRPVVITPDNWEQYGGVVERGVIYLNPFRVGTYVIFRGNFGTLRPTINTGGGPLNDGKESETPDDSQAMRYYGAQFMVFNDLEPRPTTFLTVGGLTIGSKQTAIFTMKGRNYADPTLWWHGELLQRW